MHSKKDNSNLKTSIQFLDKFIKKINLWFPKKKKCCSLVILQIINILHYYQVESMDTGSFHDKKHIKSAMYINHSRYWCCQFTNKPVMGFFYCILNNPLTTVMMSFKGSSNHHKIYTSVYSHKVAGFSQFLFVSINIFSHTFWLFLVKINPSHFLNLENVESWIMKVLNLVKSWIMLILKSWILNLESWKCWSLKILNHEELEVWKSWIRKNLNL